MRFFSLTIFSCVLVASAHTAATWQRLPKAPLDTLFIQELFSGVPSDSLVNVSSKAKDDYRKVLAFVKMSLTNGTEQERYANAHKALQLSRKLGYAEGEALSLMALSGFENTYERTDTCMQKAIRIFEESGSTNLVCLAKLNAAYNLTTLGDNHVEAFQLLRQFIAQYEYRTDYRSLSRAWNLLGEIYRYMQNNKKALACYTTAAKYAEANRNIIYLSPLINIGTIYKNIGAYDSAFFYYDKVLSLTTPQTTTEAYILNRKAQVYGLLHRNDAAMRLAAQSLKIYEALNNPQGIVLACASLAQLYFDAKNFKACVSFGERAVKEAYNIRFFQEEAQNVCKVTASALHELGLNDKAYYYESLYNEMRDRIFGPSVSLRMFDEQFKLENRNQELEKSLLTEKQKTAEEAIRYQKEIIVAIIGAFAISVLISLLLLRKNRTIRKLNVELRDKRDEIMHQADALKRSHEAIESINLNLESMVRERSEKIVEQNERLMEYAYFNAHKVRGPLARILGLVNILEIELHNQSLMDYSQMLRKAGDDLDESIREINNILEKEEEKQDTEISSG